MTAHFPDSIRAAPPIPSVNDDRMADRVDFPAASGLGFRLAVAAAGLGAGLAAGLLVAAQGVSAGGMTLGLAALAFIGGLLSTWSPCGYSSLSLLRPQGSYGLRSVVGWLPTLAMHALGYLSGALILGTGLGVLALVMPTTGIAGTAAVVLGALAAGYGLHQLRLFRMPYPQRRAQVPHDARARFGLPTISLLYGFSLGLNFLTYVRTPILYIVVGAAVLGGSLTNALILIGALNLGRFLPLVVNALPVQDWTVQRWLGSTGTRAVALDGAVLTCAGAMLAVIGLA